MYFILLIVLSALLSSFLLLLAAKWGIIEWMQTHGTRLVSLLAHCAFCLSFWANVVCSVLAAIFIGNALLLVLPLFSTPLTRKML